MIAADRDAAMELLVRFGATFNADDVNGILALRHGGFRMAPGARTGSARARIVGGKEAAREALAERAAAIRRIRFPEAEVTIAGDRNVGRFRATGEWATGAPIDVRGVDVYHLRDGLIAHEGQLLEADRLKGRSGIVGSLPGKGDQQDFGEAARSGGCGGPTTLAESEDGARLVLASR